MPLTQKEIRDRAFQFASDWAEASRERAEAQTFWNEFFSMFGLTRRRVAAYEAPVKKMGNGRGSIDLFWKGMLLVEHKSKGQDLDKAYQQALDYFPGLKEQDLPRYVLVSDFARFRLYDLEADTQHEFALARLPDCIHLFGFISGYTRRVYKDQDPVNIKVAEKMGELHDALLDNGYAGHELEQLLIRLIYCLFADDTGIFLPKDHFHYFIESRTREDGADTGQNLATIFQTLNTPEEKRQKTLDEDLQLFPYVNGSLFAEALPIPSFDGRMRKILLAACEFDWSEVSPAIFGSMFQSVMDKTKRRNLGAHYTSEKNILKVVRGLFLDDLYSEFERVKNNAGRLRTFHERLARLRFFDPACGCGNFLVITYREMRRLEIEILKQQRRLSGNQQLVTDVSIISLIDVDALYGIELEEFPARIAEVALWVVDHQMNMQLSAEFGQTYLRLPLRKTADIRHANALRLDWESFVPTPSGEQTMLCILGNPPFVGKANQNDEQKADMKLVCGKMDNFGVLDFVSAWYVKTAEFIQKTRVRVAFVSTNSITQGEQVAPLWSHLLDRGIKIHFAHRTFKWSNEARGNAQVYCVIIGFAAFEAADKRLYDYETPQSEPMEIAAKNINPYLIDVEDIVIPSRKNALCNVPPISFGSMPNDGGHLLLKSAQRDDLLREEPKAARFVRRLVGSEELINGKDRWCLWLKDASPADLRSMPEVMKRVEEVKKYRLASSREATRRLAAVPYLFGEIRQPQSNYIGIPLHSSEHRVYVPMGLLEKDCILHNSCSAVSSATLYHFGVLTSAMNMAWVRQVGGSLEGRYRYSNNIVYNNFPWPEAPTEKQKAKVEQAAQAVLDARASFPDSTLADLYDPIAMPQRLSEAHQALDAAVDACYRAAHFKTELERLEFLFALYRKYSEPLTESANKAGRKSRRKV